MTDGAAKELVDLMTKRSISLATCESITGGGIGAEITAVPGASKIYRGSLVTYAKDKLVDERKLFIFEFDRGRGYYLMNLSPAAPGKSLHAG